MLGLFAEFETNLRRERQLEGTAKAKAADVYRGRPPSIDEARVRELKAQGMRALTPLASGQREALSPFGSFQTPADRARG